MVKRYFLFGYSVWIDVVIVEGMQEATKETNHAALKYTKIAAAVANIQFFSKKTKQKTRHEGRSVPPSIIVEGTVNCSIMLAPSLFVFSLSAI